MAEHIGTEAVEDIIRRFHKNAVAVYHVVEDHFPTEDHAKDLTILADMGVGASVAVPLLEVLIKQEPDAEWREDMRPMGIDWVLRVLSANLNAHLAGVGRHQPGDGLGHHSMTGVWITLRHIPTIGAHWN